MFFQFKLSLLEIAFLSLLHHLVSKFDLCFNHGEFWYELIKDEDSISVGKAKDIAGGLGNSFFVEKIELGVNFVSNLKLTIFLCNSDLWILPKCLHKKLLNIRVTNVIWHTSVSNGILMLFVCCVSILVFASEDGDSSCLVHVEVLFRLKSGCQLSHSVSRVVLGGEDSFYLDG